MEDSSGAGGPTTTLPPDFGLRLRATGSISNFKGLADLGGRARVTAIMRELGLNDVGTPVRIAGSTNEVWRAGDYVIRVGADAASTRLAREAALAHYMPFDVQYPKVVARGSESFGEWIIHRHRPGDVLSAQWSSLERAQRRSVVQDLALAVKAVHSLPVDDLLAAGLQLDAEQCPDNWPHVLSHEGLTDLLDQASALAYVPATLVGELTELLEASYPALHQRPWVVVHGDLHFENILVKDGVLVALLDFEWARLAPPEVDIDMLARFCAQPAVHVGGDYVVRQEDFRDVLRWFAEIYGDVFSAPGFTDRLTVCAMAFELGWLVKHPPTASMRQLPRAHPLIQLAELVHFGPNAERLGWSPDFIF